MEEVAAKGGVPAGAIDARTERRMVWLLWARLLLSLLSFGIAIGLDALGRDLSGDARHGLYWTVAAAFAATLLSALWLPRMRRSERFATLQIAVDVAIVTALVHFSGGRESVFGFLYLVVAVYGAVLFGRRGAIAAVTAGAVGHGGLLLAVDREWLTSLGGASPLEPAMLLAIWCIQVGALCLVGALASALSGELQRTGAALHRSTSDLRRLRDLHQRTVESLMSGLVTLDPEQRIASFNPEAERVTGAAAESVLGAPIDRVIAGVGGLLAGAGEQGSATRKARARLRYRNERGETLWLGVAASILKDADGVPVGYVVIFQDVTHVVAMERELRRSERLAAVGEMAARIAHEIRNPLASISGSIEILRKDLEGLAGRPDSEPASLMAIVMRETERLNGLITDFLHYARPGPVRRERIALGPLLGDVRRMLEAARPEGVEIRVSLEDAAGVRGDPAQLRQLLWNLCLNGVQAMSEGGVLGVRAERVQPESSQGVADSRRNEALHGEGTPAEAQVEIAVSDSGAGIPLEVQERMFEPFFTTKRDGTGLGLATVHRIVEGHGGELRVESEPGRGTCFRVRLPAGEGPG